MPFRPLRIGELFGVPIFLHWTMWLLPVFVLIRGLMSYPIDETSMQLALIGGVYLCLFVHESGRLTVARWLSLGVVLRLRVLPSVAGVPCFEAELLDRSAAPAPCGLGFGLHPDPLIALSRAVTEAAQSRLYQICHGDDTADDPDDDAKVTASPAGPELSFAAVQRMPCTSLAQALTELAARLRAQGLPWVLRRRLNLKEDCADLDGLHVVKVVVPGCESLVGSNVRIGRRMARRLSGLDRMDPGKSQGIGQTAG